MAIESILDGLIAMLRVMAITSPITADESVSGQVPIPRYMALTVKTSILRTGTTSLTILLPQLPAMKATELSNGETRQILVAKIAPLTKFNITRSQTLPRSMALAGSEVPHIFRGLFWRNMVKAPQHMGNLGTANLRKTQMVGMLIKAMNCLPHPRRIRRPLSINLGCQ